LVFGSETSSKSQVTLALFLASLLFIQNRGCRQCTSYPFWALFSLPVFESIQYIPQCLTLNLTPLKMCTKWSVKTITKTIRLSTPCWYYTGIATSCQLTGVIVRRPDSSMGWIDIVWRRDARRERASCELLRSQTLQSNYSQGVLLADGFALCC
jgi:hypothetical protein